MHLPVQIRDLIEAIKRAFGRKLVPVRSKAVYPAAPRFRRPRRRGLTLVEMMVSVALTLLVVFALVNVFDMVGTSVTETRAMTDLVTTLRNAANLVQQDLRGATAITTPPLSPEAGIGYLEISDGPFTDRQHAITLTDGTDQYVDLANDPNGQTDSSSGSSVFIDVDGDGFIDQGPKPFDSSEGDTDDILAFTSRSESKPYIGQVTHPSISRKANAEVFLTSSANPIRSMESNLAEIIWWVQIERNIISGTDVTTLADEASQIYNAISEKSFLGGTPRSALVQRYPNQTGQTLGTPVRSLHRRVLLIRPDLDLTNVVLRTKEELASFLSNNDISVSVKKVGGVYSVTPNTLGDLTRRESRACRWLEFVPANSPSLKFTTLGDQRDGMQLLSDASTILRHATMKDMVLTNANGTVFMLRRGDDIVLNDVMAFDVQVYDPDAPVYSLDGTTMVAPSDPGFPLASENFAVTSQNVSRGAFVDLGWGVPPKRWNENLHGRFSGRPHPKSQLVWSPPGNTPSTFSNTATYCTWSDSYERDGVAQGPGNIPDEGTNGFDDDGKNGVDDPGEMETSPPYPSPLRGITIKLRNIDIATRQVRQTSVAVDFLPE